jgi:hypothetical protein
VKKRLVYALLLLALIVIALVIASQTPERVDSIDVIRDTRGPIFVFTWRGADFECPASQSDIDALLEGSVLVAPAHDPCDFWIEEAK